MGNTFMNGNEETFDHAARQDGVALGLVLHWQQGAVSQPQHAAALRTGRAVGVAGDAHQIAKRLVLHLEQTLVVLVPLSASPPQHTQRASTLLRCSPSAVLPLSSCQNSLHRNRTVSTSVGNRPFSLQAGRWVSGP